MRQGLILQIMNETDYYLKEENKKSIELMKDELGGKITKEFLVLWEMTVDKKTVKK